MMHLILETTDLAPVLDDVRADLPADLLGLSCESRLSGLHWRKLVDHLDDDDFEVYIVRHGAVVERLGDLERLASARRSYAQIADSFNERGMQTKRKCRWNAASVNNIFQRWGGIDRIVL